MSSLTGTTVTLGPTPIALNAVSAVPITLYLAFPNTGGTARLGDSSVSPTNGYRHKLRSIGPYRIPPGAQMYAAEDSATPGVSITALTIEE